MVKTELLSGTEALGNGVLACKADLIDFPLKFSSEVADCVRKTGSVQGVASRFSLASAAMANISMGRRTFLAYENDSKKLAEMRMPVVIANLYGCGLRVRDNGCLLFTPETNQDIIDSVIQLYRVCEDPKVLLPGIINIDSPDLMEPVIVPTEQAVNKFLSPLKVSRLDVKNPLSIIYDADPKAQQDAMENALNLIENLGEKWKKAFKRDFNLAEKYHTDDAELVIVISGSQASTGKVVVDQLRSQGKKVGILGMKVIRPWPAEFVADAIGEKKVGVIDQDVSIGANGILYSEVKSCFDGFCSGFIVKRRLQEKDFVDIFDRLEKNEEERLWL